MIRTQILLDRATHEALRRSAAARGKSVSAFVREALGCLLGSAGGVRRRGRRYAWTFIGKGRDIEGRTDVSEHVDEVLAQHERW